MKNLAELPTLQICFKLLSTFSSSGYGSIHHTSTLLQSSGKPAAALFSLFAAQLILQGGLVLSGIEQLHKNILQGTLILRNT